MTSVEQRRTGVEIPQHIQFIISISNVWQTIDNKVWFSLSGGEPFLFIANRSWFGSRQIRTVESCSQL